MNRALELLVWRRAERRCEYCQLPQTQVRPPHQVDHVIAEQHGGETSEQNLALACIHCNKRKGPNVAGVDPTTRRIVPLFNPRRQQWRRHFSWEGSLIVGRTAIGRATVRTLAMNHPTLVLVRQALMEEGAFFKA